MSPSSADGPRPPDGEDPGWLASMPGWVRVLGIIGIVVVVAAVVLVIGGVHEPPAGGH